MRKFITSASTSRFLLPQILFSAALSILLHGSLLGFRDSPDAERPVTWRMSTKNLLTPLVLGLLPIVSRHLAVWMSKPSMACESRMLTTWVRYLGMMGCSPRSSRHQANGFPPLPLILCQGHWSSWWLQGPSLAFTTGHCDRREEGNSNLIFQWCSGLTTWGNIVTYFPTTFFLPIHPVVWEAQNDSSASNSGEPLLCLLGQIFLPWVLKILKLAELTVSRIERNLFPVGFRYDRGLWYNPAEGGFALDSSAKHVHQ